MNKLILSVLLSCVVLSAQAPLNKPQPNTKTYSINELQNFKTYTRESFEKEFGVQAPVFNPNRPAKTWFDKTVTTARVEYVGLDYAGSTPVYKKFSLSKEEAETVNLPGAYRFPTWNPAATECVVTGWWPGSKDNPLSPSYLSTRAEAEELNIEIGGQGVFPTTSMVRCPASETRSWWEIEHKGNRLVAGLLLATKYRDGVGHPGSWDLSGQEPAWISQAIPTGIGVSNYARVPIRQLLPNERFKQISPFSTVIERTDIPDPTQTGGDGSFTPSDRALLEEIRQLLKSLLQK